jgi:hypothetical protein
LSAVLIMALSAFIRMRKTSTAKQIPAH